MAIRQIDIPFPLEGLNRALGFSDQPTRTSRDILNTRAVDEITQRVRGCSRSGLRRLINAQTGNVVRRLDSVVIDEHRLTYGYAASPAADFAIQTPGKLNSNCVATDQYGDVYWLDGESGWTKTNSSGGVIWHQAIPVPSAGATATYTLTSIVVDEDRSVYVSTGSFAGVSTAPTYQNSRIWKWRVNDEGDGYILAWTLNPTNYLVPQLKLKDGSLFAVLFNLSLGAGARTARIVWYDDISRAGDLPPDGTSGLPVNTDHSVIVTQALCWNAVAGLDCNVKSFDVKALGASGYEFLICGTDGNTSKANQWRFLTKIDNIGTQRWTQAIVTHGTVAGGAGNSETGGIGYGCLFDSVGNFVSIGSATNSSNIWLAKYTDSAFGVAPAVAWSKAQVGVSITYEFPRFCFDVRNAVYVPFNDQGGAITQEAVHVYNSTGTLLTSSGLEPTYPSTSAARLCRAVAIPPSNPVNEPVFRVDDNKIAEAVYCANNEFPAAPNLRAMQRRRLLSVTTGGGSPRSLYYVSAEPPNIRVFSSTFFDPTNGAASLNASARYISTAQLFGNLFFTDGLGKYRYLDPRPDATNTHGVVYELVSRTSGVIPPRARLMFAWRARLGISRTADDPHNIYMSAEGNPFGWDFAPTVPTIGDAFAANLTLAGSIPDIPNAFIPINDDFLLVLCDHSIWLISGNPLRGGEIDRVSGSIGGSFGKPWCMDAVGNIYFHGSRGGIYMMPPKALPIRISTTSIDADLAKLDLEDVYVELAWDDALKGIHVFTLPYGAISAGVHQHWFFDERTKGWTPQRFGGTGATSVQPTAVAVIDGDDPGDRLLLLAGEDRYVRKFDPTTKDDDGTPIYSYVVIGPIVPRSDGPNRSRLISMEITLASDRGGCNYELYASDTPDVLGAPFGSGHLNPGYNRIRTRARGRYIFVKLFNAAAGVNWAFESATAITAPSGRVCL